MFKFKLFSEASMHFFHLEKNQDQVESTDFISFKEEGLVSENLYLETSSNEYKIGQTKINPNPSEEANSEEVSPETTARIKFSYTYLDPTGEESVTGLKDIPPDLSNLLSFQGGEEGETLSDEEKEVFGETIDVTNFQPAEEINGSDDSSSDNENNNGPFFMSDQFIFQENNPDPSGFQYLSGEYNTKIYAINSNDPDDPQSGIADPATGTFIGYFHPDYLFLASGDHIPDNGGDEILLKLKDTPQQDNPEIFFTTILPQDDENLTVFFNNSITPTGFSLLESDGVLGGFSDESFIFTESANNSILSVPIIEGIPADRDDLLSVGSIIGQLGANEKIGGAGDFVDTNNVSQENVFIQNTSGQITSLFDTSNTVIATFDFTLVGVGDLV